jgi:hypothetical protein
MSEDRIEKIRRIADEARSYFWRTENWRVEISPDPDEDEEATRIVYDRRSDTKPKEKLCPCLDESRVQQIICNFMNEAKTIAHLMDDVDRYKRIMLATRKHLQENTDRSGASASIIFEIDKVFELPPF